jgi:ABC-type multidrug transport system fused ATPase/permease subunit
MAKLPNIIEKDRSLWMIIKFVFRASIKGSKKYALLRYGASALSSVFMFVEFGALGMVINEFSARGIHGARMSTIVFAFFLIVISTLVPVILSSLRQFFSDSQSNDMQRYLQKLIFTKMEAIDTGTIEQPEFQNLLDVANSRGWGAVFNIIAIISNSLGNIIALVLATISLIVISPVVLVVILISVLPTYLLERKNAERTAELWKRTSETRRIWQAKSGPVYGKSSLIELKNFTLVGVFLKGWTDLIGNFHDEAKQLNKQNTFNEILTALLVTVGYGIGFFLIIHQVITGALLHRFSGLYFCCYFAISVCTSVAV